MVESIENFFPPPKSHFSPEIIVFGFCQQVKYTFLQGFKFQNSNNAFKLSTHWITLSLCVYTRARARVRVCLVSCGSVIYIEF